MYFVDDHFLLQPKRIQAICKGSMRTRSRLSGGARARRLGLHGPLPRHGKGTLPDADVWHPKRESKILDRLKKEQTLQQNEMAVDRAKDAGIEIVDGFSVVGIPDETEEDLRPTLRLPRSPD